MAVKIFIGNTIDSIPEGLVTFFVLAPEYFEKACLTDPANEEKLIDEYLDIDNTREEIISLIDTEKEIAKTAIENEQSGDESSAIENWKDIFISNTIVSNVNENSISSSGPTIINSPSKLWCDVA